MRLNHGHGHDVEDAAGVGVFGIGKFVIPPAILKHRSAFLAARKRQFKWPAKPRTRSLEANHRVRENRGRPSSRVHDCAR